MPFYHRLGQIPPKRHTTFEKPSGGYYYEQLFGTEGFSGMASLLYHVHRPTMIREIGHAIDLTPKVAISHNITPRKLIGFQVPPQADFLDSRTALMVNSDVVIGVAAPQQSMTGYFYKMPMPTRCCSSIAARESFARCWEVSRSSMGIIW